MVCLSDYPTSADAEAHLAAFSSDVYSTKWLDYRLGSRPPAEFGAAYALQTAG